MDIQLNLFEESKEERLENEVKRLQEQGEKIRKSLYAKYTELMQLYLEVRAELETLKSNLPKAA